MSYQRYGHTGLWNIPNMAAQGCRIFSIWLDRGAPWAIVGVGSGWGVGSDLGVGSGFGVGSGLGVGSGVGVGSELGVGSDMHWPQICLLEAV